ncbi:Stabilin-2 [Acipenser ruthenus]|uniref:Stabilin-2 n=1 Tax=Acipenser ruthenus TaxID=7906 RepID=A0A444U440_ACIRT|nr:Stabilin-2 [Acipenser ruthenus]
MLCSLSHIQYCLQTWAAILPPGAFLLQHKSGGLLEQCNTYLVQGAKVYSIAIGEDNADDMDYKAEEEVCYLVAVVAPGPLLPTNRAGGLDPLWPIGAPAKEGSHGPQQAEEPDKRQFLHFCSPCKDHEAFHVALEHQPSLTSLNLDVSNRCDKKTLINVNTVCQSCTVSKEVDCLAGYLKKTQGIGNRDCSHVCAKEFLDPHCCPGYWGSDCMAIPECAALECPDKARCIEDAVSGKLVCKCLPDHEADGKNCKSINPCLKQVCHQNANCAHLGPNQHQCTCHEGYQGDGQVCMPVDPCQISFGNCPPDSSVCIYDGPGKSHCQCKEGFENLVPGIGCRLTDICKTNNPCSKNANCSTIDPGTTECTCNKGYAGNGKICYGSIIERLRELNTEPGGKWTGQLSSAITLFDSSLSWPLKSLGPFTVFVPINKGFKGTSMKSLMDNQLNALYLSKLHVIAGELNIETLKKSDIYYTLTGKSGETVFSTEDQQVKIRIHGSKKKGNILQGDIVASNGLIHIVSKLMDNVEPTVESEKEENLMTILADNGKFNRFRSLLQKFNVAQLLEQPGPFSLFAPTNGALESMEAGTLEYLLSSELEVVNIVSSPRLTTMANQALTFNITNNGQILVNGKVILEADIQARNGRLYSLEGVLIPPSIIPVLPHRCDVTESQVKMDTFKRGCVFTSNVLGMNVPSLGCAQYCNETTTVPLCCKGFYGPVCSPCPGGFTNPCSGHGKCMDGISGNGTCICEENFRGSRCQLCSSHEKYGPNCDKKCPCIHGECDNRPESSGACKEGTCQSDYTGKFCERHTSPCGPRVQFCHAHATCDYSSGTVSCVCKQGYQGDGTTCEEIDPCSNPERGGCSVNAKCIKTGPGTHICQCLVGWRTDGDECQEINNCMEPNRGGCHENANCIYIGPGQELSAIPDAVEFTKWVNAAEIYEILSEDTNRTVFVPSESAIEKMNKEDKDFWTSNGNLPSLIKYHMVLGIYKLGDLQNLSSSSVLLTSLHRNSLHVSKRNEASPLRQCDGNSTVIEDAAIIASNIAATNGVIHIIDKVLTPDRGQSEALPDLLTQLDKMPECSIFRGYIIQYGLAKQIEGSSAYTVFVPSNNVIESFLKENGSTTLDENHIRYHIVLSEKLKKQDLQNGIHKETMLGFSYQLGFFLRESQLFVNDAQVNYTDVETSRGVIHGLGKVLQVQRNRCDQKTSTNTQGKCAACHLKADCPLGTEAVAGKSTSCINSHYILGKRFMYFGCRPVCVNTIIKRDCCTGFFGAQCESCPRVAGRPCFGNGVCQDGVNGTGVCICKQGFTGTACENCETGKYGPSCDQEINPCLVNNGGCHLNAECTHTGPSQSACNCISGYSGDGKICKSINPCFKKNGGCSEFAICNHTGPAERNCTCKSEYIGDGFKCKGTVYKANVVRDLAGQGPFTVFVPSSDAFENEANIKQWDTRGLMPQILRYHMVACSQLQLSELNKTKTVTTLQGELITISYSQDSIFLNNKAKILSSDILSSNGIIHTIDKVLVPENLQVIPTGVFGSKLENLTTVAERQGYSTFSKLLQILAADLPNSEALKTLQGSDLHVNCGDEDNIGALFLNNRKCRIVQRQLEFSGGIAHGIDCMLTPPSVGGRCDTLDAVDLMGDCGPCYKVPPCPTGSKPQKTTKNCVYSLLFKKSFDGCQQVCSVVIWRSKCCPGYFGVDCQACPGGPESPCNSHGKCDEGKEGRGECTCNTGFHGVACELCAPGRYGQNCQVCNCTEHGACDEGDKGTGTCFCEKGWTGPLCETQLAVTPVCSPSCSTSAVCKENNTCECKPFYEGDGRTCTVVNLCQQQNGRCAKEAHCTQKGVTVTCSCPKGYSGDGYTCVAINPCVTDNGECHEHATCTMTGPNKRMCECKSSYIGDGEDCAVKELPINGQCHTDAICTDLHFEDSTVGVFLLRSPQGQYKLVYEAAKEGCRQKGATIATYNQLSYAQQAGFHMCAAGWLAAERVAYPTAYSNPKCGFGQVGIVDYKVRSNLSETWDAYCYRMKNVQCACKPGYIGDGYSCSGNLLQVLTANPIFSNFLSQILTYSNNSRRGEEFVNCLSNLTIQATLFVPDNSALNENETLSERDIEYHLSDGSAIYFGDLTNGSKIPTRLGNSLLISGFTDLQNPSINSTTRYVNDRYIIDWDILAANGIIHVIQEPLQAPPPKPALHASHKAFIGVGLFLTVILIGLVGFAAYHYYSRRSRPFQFHYFKSDEGEDIAPIDVNPSICNPMYEAVCSPHSRDFDAVTFQWLSQSY